VHNPNLNIPRSIHLSTSTVAIYNEETWENENASFTSPYLILSVKEVP